MTRGTTIRLDIGRLCLLSIIAFTHCLHRIFSRWSRRARGSSGTVTVAIIAAGPIRAMIPHCSTTAINVSRSRLSEHDGYALLSSARVPFAASFVGSIAVKNRMVGRTSFRALMRSICRTACVRRRGRRSGLPPPIHVVKYAV